MKEKKLKTEGIKGKIKDYYGSIARSVSDSSKASCGCGQSCCPVDPESEKLYTKEYIEGLPAEAVNASLGCANPIVLADLQEGETALDLGAGGGIDAFISSKYVGEKGKVYGLDMTDDMIALANRNKEKMGVRNVEFLKGYIEEIPLENNTIDVVLSNCVINLSDDKEKALGEAFRVLKHGGRLAIADIIQLKPVPESIKENIQMWLGCFSGALTEEEYIKILSDSGFQKIEITVVNPYSADILSGYADSKNGSALFSELDKTQFDGAYAGAHIKAVKP